MSSSWVVPLLGTCVAITVVVVLKGRPGSASTKDPYGSFHLALNEDDDAPEVGASKQPRSEWLNMGFWQGTDNFPKACEALALKLTEAAKCQTGGRVLDVGHGSGDSLLLHLKHPSVPRPGRLIGITSLASHHRRAVERVNEAITRYATTEDVEVELILGDAVYRPNDPLSEKHPLRPEADNYTAILALDCAYHFDTRHIFLAQSFTHLSPGGRIALADICFANDTSPSPFLRCVLGLLGIMPTANVLTTQEYIRDMMAIGYTDVQLTDISEHVFPGFINFLSKRGLLWKAFVGVLGMLVNRGARSVLVSGQKTDNSSLPSP